MALILLLIGATVVAKFFWLLVAFVATVVAARLLGAWLARRDDARPRRGAGMWSARRADRQNQLVLAGDDRGIYGAYPPAV